MTRLSRAGTTGSFETSDFDILEGFRSQPQLSRLAFFVLTCSALDRDRERPVALGAKAYLG